MIEEIEFDGIKAKVRKGTMDEATIKEIFKKREYKKLNFTPNDVVLDLGMNIGMFSIYALNKGVKKIYSFEPSKDNFQLAKENIKLNNIKDRRYVLSNKAVVGNGDKKRCFYENLATNKGAHSLIETKGRNNIVVGCVNINDVVKKINPTIIKMDIEGAEYECLKELKIWNGVNQLILEFHHKTLKDIETHTKYNEILHLLKSKFNNVEGREDTKGSWYSLIYCSNYISSPLTGKEIMATKKKVIKKPANKNTFKYSKNNKFWRYSKGGDDTDIYLRKLRDFIQNGLGISIYKEDGEHNYGGEELFVKIDNGIIDVINEGEVNRELRNSIEDANLWEGVSVQELDCVYNSLLGTTDSKVKNIMKTLDVFGGHESKFFRDTKNKSYILLAGKVRGEEEVVEITSSSITKMLFTDLPRDRQKMLVWRNQFLKLPDAMGKLKGKQKFKLKVYGESGWKKIDGKLGDWNRYITAICSFPVRDDDNNIIEFKYDPVRSQLLKRMGGFLGHSYKDQRFGKAMCLVDSSGASTKETSGGSGKSIFFKSLKFLRHQCWMDGEKASTKEGASKFMWVRVKRDHTNLLLDDVNEKFNFPMLKAMLCEDFVVEGKGGNEILYKFDNSPKFSISTNFALTGEGTSFDRRRFVLEVSNYFTAKDDNGNYHNPIANFLNNREMLSNEWGDDDWNYFYNWWFRAIQYWLEMKDIPDRGQPTIQKTGGLPEKSIMEGFGIVLENQKIQKMVQTGVDLDDQYYYLEQIEKYKKLKLPEITLTDFMEDYVERFGLDNNSDEENKELKKRIKIDFEVVVKAEGLSLKKNKGQNRYMKNVQARNDDDKKLQEMFHILGLKK